MIFIISLYNGANVAFAVSNKLIFTSKGNAHKGVIFESITVKGVVWFEQREVFK